MGRHGRTRCAAAFVIAAGVCFEPVAADLASGESQEDLSIAALEREWTKGRGEVVSAPGGCSLGLHVEERGRRIIGISPPALGTPIAHGDTLVAVNSLPVADGAAFDALLSGLPGAGVATVTIERYRKLRDVEIACADRDAWRRKLIEGIDAALGGRSYECRTVTLELDAMAGLRTGHAKLRYECAQARRIADGRARSADDAMLYYEIYYRLGASARFSGAYREQVRAEVERAAEYLRGEGFSARAAKLELLLETPTRTRER